MSGSRGVFRTRSIATRSEAGIDEIRDTSVQNKHTRESRYIPSFWVAQATRSRAARGTHLAPARDFVGSFFENKKKWSRRVSMPTFRVFERTQCGPRDLNEPSKVRIGPARKARDGPLGRAPLEVSSKVSSRFFLRVVSRRGRIAYECLLFGAFVEREREKRPCEALRALPLSREEARYTEDFPTRAYARLREPSDRCRRR